MQKFYITTPIYYVNGAPHIGHAYTNIASDALARFKRQDGCDVMFLTGTDEHGQKIEKAAQAVGEEPKKFVDRMSQNFRNLCNALNINHDYFIRTTEERHKNYVAEIWRRLLANGDIYEGEYSGWYARNDEAFYKESELIDGKAPTGAEVVWLSEPCHFFRLSAWQQRLLDFYEQHPNFIMPRSRYNEVISFVQSGLEDLCISRSSFTWGIPVPNQEGHVVYVWLDALFNYLSAIDGEQSHYWPCDVHIIGKDILRFHAIFWPAFLMALNIPLPKRIFAHGWWTNDNQKISKSLGNVIDPLELIEKFNVDYVRYFLLREIPFGNDGNYSEEAFKQRINSELANNIGNLAQRVLSFLQAKFEGIVPEVNLAHFPSNESGRALLAQAYVLAETMREYMDNQQIHLAIGAIVQLASNANEYVAQNPFWDLIKSNQEQANEVIYILLEILRIIGIALHSFTPHSADVLLEQLIVPESARNFASISPQHRMRFGMRLPKPKPIFTRIDG